MHSPFSLWATETAGAASSLCTLNLAWSSRSRWHTTGEGSRCHILSQDWAGKFPIAVSCRGENRGQVTEWTQRPTNPPALQLPGLWCTGWGLTRLTAANAARSLGRSYLHWSIPVQLQGSSRDKKQPETSALPTADSKEDQFSPPGSACHSRSQTRVKRKDTCFAEW